MIDIKKYKGQKVYIELEKKLDDNDPEEEDKVEGGAIYKSIEEVMSVASDGDEFLEIEINGQYKAMDRCMQFVKFEDGKIITKE